MGLPVPASPYPETPLRRGASRSACPGRWLCRCSVPQDGPGGAEEEPQLLAVWLPLCAGFWEPKQPDTGTDGEAPRAPGVLRSDGSSRAAAFCRILRTGKLGSDPAHGEAGVLNHRGGPGRVGLLPDPRVRSHRARCASAVRPQGPRAGEMPLPGSVRAWSARPKGAHPRVRWAPSETSKEDISPLTRCFPEGCFYPCPNEEC